MPIWLVHTGLCLLCFGFWGFFSRVALNTIPPVATLVFQTVGIIMVTLCLLKPMIDKPQLSFTGGFYAILTGIAFTLGSILFFKATNYQGKVSIVITMTALYPLVTILLAWAFLQEPITIKQGCGMGLAVLAMVLLST